MCVDELVEQRSLVGRLDNALANLRDAAQAGIAAGANLGLKGTASAAHKLTVSWSSQAKPGSGARESPAT